MPQFDILTFIVQLFWFFVGFSIIFFIVYKYKLLEIYRTLAMRKKILTFLNTHRNNKIEAKALFVKVFRNVFPKK